MNYTLTNSRLNKTYDIVTGILEIPIQGVWITTSMNIDTDDDFKDGDSITMSFIDKTLSGTFVDTVNYNGYVVGTVVGGKNTMSNTLESVGYTGVSVNTIVSFIAKKTGHTIDPLSNSKLLSTAISRFESLTTTASDMLEKCLQPYNGIWRITLDGKLFIGYEEFPNITTKYPTLIEGKTFDILNKKQELGYWSIYNEDILIEPAFSIEGNQVKETIYDLNNESSQNITIKLSFFDPDHVMSYELNDQSRDTLYHKRYRMKVTQQKPDGTLTIFPQPDLLLLKNGIRDVPIVYPMPDMKIKVKPGAICYVEFANGSPGYPIVTGWDNNSNLIEVQYGASKQPKKVARVGDTVDLGSIVITAAPMTGVITGTYTYPVTTPPHVPPTIPIAAGKIDLHDGLITSGSNIVLAGS